MREMAHCSVWMLFICFSSVIKGSISGETCHTGWLDYEYCTYGCCERYWYSDYEYCCSSSSGSGSSYFSYTADQGGPNWVALIIGCTVGGVVLLTIIISTCVFICVKCCGSQTHIHPTVTAPNPGPNVIATGAAQGQCQGGIVHGNFPTNQYHLAPIQGTSQGYTYNQVVLPPITDIKGQEIQANSTEQVPTTQQQQIYQ